MISTLILLTDVFTEGNSYLSQEAASLRSLKLNFLAGDVSSSDAYSSSPELITYRFTSSLESIFTLETADLMVISPNGSIASDLGAQIGVSFTGSRKINFTLTDPSFINVAPAPSELIQFWG